MKPGSRENVTSTFPTSRLSRLHDFHVCTTFRSDFRFPDYLIKLALTNILICYMYFSDLQIINHIFCKLFVIYNNRNERSHRAPRGIISSPGWYYNPGVELLSHAPWAAPIWRPDRKSTRLNSSHITRSRMPSSA